MSEWKIVQYNEASKRIPTPNWFDRLWIFHLWLVQMGYKDDDNSKIIDENALRVMEAVEK